MLVHLIVSIKVSTRCAPVWPVLPPCCLGVASKHEVAFDTGGYCTGGPSFSAIRGGLCQAAAGQEALVRHLHGTPGEAPPVLTPDGLVGVRRVFVSEYLCKQCSCRGISLQGVCMHLLLTMNWGLLPCSPCPLASLQEQQVQTLGAADHGHSSLLRSLSCLQCTLPCHSLPVHVARPFLTGRRNG